MASFGVAAHRLGTKRFAELGSYTEVILYLAGVPGDAPFLRSAKLAGVQNVLCSVAHGTSRGAAHRLTEAGSYYKMILYHAGVPVEPGNRKWVWHAINEGNASGILSSFGGHKTTREYLKDFVQEHKEVILYLAGSLTPDRLEQMGDRAGARNWLETFAHKGSQDVADYFIERRFDLRLFIDSGAFTAWAKGTPIVLKEYMTFCHELIEKAACPLTFAALDVIAGSRSGAPPSAEDFEVACKQGWENYLEMKADGIQSLPTFHQGDAWDWLYRLAEDTDYIAVAPRKVGKSTGDKMRWLNEVFTRLGPRAYSTLKIHGLGISSPVMMETYPFYSVDSTAWLQGGRSGSYRYFDGHRAPLAAASEWRRDTSNCLEAVHHYRPQGQSTEDGQFGTYWYAEQCMAADVKLEAYITEHWRARGVVWDE